HGRDTPSKLRNIALDNFPNAGHVDPQIIVHQDIAKSRNFLPIDFGVLVLQCCGNALTRFSKDLEVSQDSVLRLRIPEKPLLAVGGVSLDARKTLENVDQVELVVFHNATASSSTLSRMNQCNPSGSTTS